MSCRECAAWRDPSPIASRMAARCPECAALGALDGSAPREAASAQATVRKRSTVRGAGMGCVVTQELLEYE